MSAFPAVSIFSWVWIDDHATQSGPVVPGKMPGRTRELVVPMYKLAVQIQSPGGQPAYIGLERRQRLSPLVLGSRAASAGESRAM